MLFVSLYYAYKTELTVLFSFLCEVLTSICATHLLKKNPCCNGTQRFITVTTRGLSLHYPAEWSISQSLSCVRFRVRSCKVCPKEVLTF